MPKRKRNVRKKSRRRKKAKAKTRVDKRQDRVIRKLVLESMPEKKWCDQQLQLRIPDAWDPTPATYQGFDLTGQIPIWNTTGTNSNNERTHSREGLSILAKSINISGQILPPQVGDVQYNSAAMTPGRISAIWPEHFIIRVMVVCFPKPCQHNGAGPNLEDLLETPKWQHTRYDVSPPMPGFNALLRTSPFPEHSRFVKPYDGDRFSVVYNRVFTMEGAKQNILNNQPTPGIGFASMSSVPTYDAAGIITGSIGSDVQPTGQKSSRKIRININIPINKKLIYEQTGSGSHFGIQTTNKYKLYAYACNDLARNVPSNPLCHMDITSRIHFTDP